MSVAPPEVRFGAASLRIPVHPFRLETPPRPPAPEVAADVGDLLAAIDRPAVGPSLEARVRGKRSAVVVVSDGSRATGVREYLPAFLDRLRAAGVATVSIAIASGLHRRPDGADAERILGAGVAAKETVVLHDPDRDADLAVLGTTRAGTPVRVHRALLEHEAVVLTGAVGFHYYAGFSGGRKAVVPGLAARETIVGNHLRALRDDGSREPAARAGNLVGNPVHRDMLESATLVRPTFLVNTVMAEDGRIERVFAGDWIRAHRLACRHVLATRRVRIEPRPLVVVSAGGAPHDVDLVQSHKAFEAAFPAVAPGGCVVLVASCPEGFGPPDFESGLAVPDEAALVADLRRDYRVYRQTALAWRRKLASCRLVLVSSMPEAAVRAAGAEPARDLSAALRIAAAHLPRGAAGWVLPHGVRWLLEPSVAFAGAGA